MLLEKSLTPDVQGRSRALISAHAHYGAGIVRYFLDVIVYF